MTRDEFLREHWQAYPAAPEGAEWTYGRFARTGEKAFTLSSWQAEKGLAEIPFSCDGVVLLHGAPDAFSPSQVFSLLRSGDWLAVRQSEDGTKLVLLAPCRMSPENFHRLPLEGTPLRTTELSETVKQFSHFRQKVRQFFLDQHFLELATPTLVSCPGTEIFLDVFKTQLQLGSSTQGRSYALFLPTSPELHLKKALALGMDRIFEMRSCFRNGEVSDKHNPEFTMLEWYRAFANLEQIQKDCQNLIRHLTAMPLEFSQVSVADLFDQLGFHLTPQTSLQTLKDWARRLGLVADHYENWDDVFHLIFVDRIEPFLPSQQPLFVVDYPPSQAALARVNERGWADRFELYWRGFEIANAYFELNDPFEQRRRSVADLEQRVRLGKEKLNLDEEFLAALEMGLPPSAGIALGVERLFMAAAGIREIQRLSPFAWSSSDSGN